MKARLLIALGWLWVLASCNSAAPKLVSVLPSPAATAILLPDHAGDADQAAPPAWSADLCRRLQELGKEVECFTYANLPHTFNGAGDTLFTERTIAFFNRR